MSPGSEKVSFRFLLGVFFASASAISFEITLTRVFSISLGHHFAAMVISIGMLGIGMSGTLQSLVPSLKDMHRMGGRAILLGVSIPAGYVLMNLLPLDPARIGWDPSQLLYITLYYLLLGIPFFFFGLIVSTALSLRSGESGSIYGADLIGAGAGALVSFPVIGLLGSGGAVFALAVLAAVSAYCFGASRRAYALAALALLVPLLFPSLTQVRMSPYRGLEHALRYPGARHLETYETGFSRVDIFKSPAVRFAPGLNVNYLNDLPLQVGLAVDGAGITAITNTSGESLSFLGELPSALPYELRERNRVCVIDPKGGLPVLLARHAGAREVIAMESDPLVLRAVRQYPDRFTGGIYGKDTRSGLARSRLLMMPGGFDLIDLSLMGSAPFGVYGASEDYRLTREAFGVYLDSLAPEGMLSVSVYLLPPPRAELRILVSAMSALERRGVKAPERHIAAIRSFATLTMVVKPAPLTSAEIQRLKAFAERNGFDLVHYPGMRPEEGNRHIQMPEDYYYRAFAALLSDDTQEAFRRQYAFDISPVTDDRPFFHYYLKAGKYRDAYRLMSGKWQFFLEEGWLQPAVFVQAVVLSLVILCLPLLFGRGRRPAPSPMLLYFAFIGLGFMFVEVPLIQKLILALENPSYAFATVLCSLLISSGAGSMAGQRMKGLGSPVVVLALALLIIFYGMALLYLAGRMLALPLAWRFVLSFVLLLPLGFLMGLPFPLGIRVLGRRNPRLIPWAWAVNGCFSVLAPLVASMGAMAAGFRGVFIAGALMYAAAWLVVRGRAAT